MDSTSLCREHVSMRSVVGAGIADINSASSESGSGAIVQGAG
jgi:hypothetical protein